MNFTAARSLPSSTGVDPHRYGLGAWSDHIPFAFDLISILRPKILVELGVFTGESFFAFCQAVQECQLHSVCYGVDTWTGDRHTGPLAARVFEDVNTYARERYGASAYLLRSTFDAARDQFSDESIDLLHIDGLHTYEAVRHDFDFWLPKVRSGGVILFHDIAARHDDFGVWKLWEEIEPLAPSFAFIGGWGLGVWRKPCGSANDALDIFFPSTEESITAMRTYYGRAAGDVRARKEKTPNPPADVSGCPKRGRDRVAQVFFPLTDGTYSEKAAETRQFRTGRWVKIHATLPSYFSHGVIRFDPLNGSGLIDVAGVKLRSSGGELLWMCRGPECLRTLQAAGTAGRLDHNSWFRIFSHGPDPQVLLPPLSATPGGEGGELEITFRALAEWSDGPSQFVSLLETLRRSEEVLARQSAAVSQAQTERLLAVTERDCAVRELMELPSLRPLPGTLMILRSQLQELETHYKTELGRRRSMARSASWRATIPFRAVMRFLRTGSFTNRR